MDERGTATTPAGWYPDPDWPGQVRYWNGAGWTDQRAVNAPRATSGPDTWTIARGVAIGILAAVAVVVLMVNVGLL